MTARDAGLAETIVSTTPVSRRNRAADTKRITTAASVALEPTEFAFQTLHSGLLIFATVCIYKI
jgi:hypothetical protein